MELDREPEGKRKVLKISGISDGRANTNRKQQVQDELALDVWPASSAFVLMRAMFTVCETIRGS